MKKILLSLSVVFLMTGCLGKNESTSTTPPQASESKEGAVIARINGTSITDEDVRKIAGSKLAQAEMELYDARKEAIDQIVDEKLLEESAKGKKITKDDLLKKEVYDKIKIEDKDVEKFFNEKKDQMQGKKLDEVKPSIKSFLFREKYQKLYGDLSDSLRKKANLEILIKAPKMDVEAGDNPSMGPKDAPVQMIEFTDYQCPFCGRARPAINQILETYKGKVYYVLRDFPLSFHKDSIKAHESAHCAGDQGKYWEMNKKLFADQQAIKVEDLKKYAGEIKLNQKKFDECLDSGKYTDKVQKNQQYGETVGVSGTPAFFINGRMLSGARPFENFKSIIEDELRSFR